MTKRAMTEAEAICAAAMEDGAAEAGFACVTALLRNGQRVLGKMYKGAPVAKTFANLTQARAAAEKVGGYVKAGWPFYVVFKEG